MNELTGLPDLLSKLSRLKRTAFRPVVEPKNGSLIASKFSGVPWLAQNEAWPVCLNCNQPLPFFLQLNLDQLPEPLRDRFGTGLLQMFYCIDCEIKCEAWEPFQKSTLLRIVEPDNENRRIPFPEFKEVFPARTITGWEAFDDYPNSAYCEEEGFKLEPVELNILNSLEDMAYSGRLEWNAPSGGDKLSGWPAWVQWVEYPNCPLCQQRMNLVFQLDSEDNLPYMFGDVGCGHITQCPDHKDQLAFGWSCY